MKKELIIKKIVEELKRQAKEDVYETPYVGDIDCNNSILIDGYVDLNKLAEALNEI